MSNIKVRSTPPPAQPSQQRSATAGDTAAPSSAAPGALDLGVDVGVLSDLPAGESYTVAPEKVSDSFADDGPRADDGQPKDAAPRESRDVRRAQNPFRELPRTQTAPPPRALTAQALPLDAEVDLPMSVAAKLCEAEAELGADHAPTFNKVRQGNLLVTTDGQSARAGKAPVDSDGLTRLAQAMVSGDHDQDATNAAVKQFAKGQARFLKAGNMDIQAYVQRVLRESYQVQNELLYDYAEKVKFFNEKKKKVRGQLTKGRSTLTQWRTKEKVGEPGAFIADEPFAYLELGKDGQWSQPEMTEKDVESWRAATDAAAKARGKPESIAAHYEDFMNGDSHLTHKDVAILELAMSGQGHEWLEENSADIAAAVTRMSPDDFDRYFFSTDRPTLLDNVRTSDASVYHAVLMSITPVQTLYFASKLQGDVVLSRVPGFISDGDDRRLAHGVAGGAGGAFATGAAAGTVGGPIGALAGGLISMLGAVFSGAMSGVATASFEDALDGEQEAQYQKRVIDIFMAASEETGVDLTEEVDAESATVLLRAVGRLAQDGGDDGPFGAAPKVGDPKTMNVPNQLDDYLEKLERDLNGIGDDAQIANADLQSALQKQQQTLQMMTNIGKMLHDTAMAIVRKSGQ